VCCHGNETRAPIANPFNGAQLDGTPYHSPSYMRIRAVMWECGEGQTDRHTDTRSPKLGDLFIRRVWGPFCVMLAEAVYMANEDECIDASEELNVGATLTTVDVQAILTTQLR